MAKLTPVEKLASEIIDILVRYEDDITAVSTTAVEEAAKAGAKALRAASPKKTGEYAKGWKARIERGRLETTATLYNSGYPGLAHLLEYGHLLRNGTRRNLGTVPPRVHIEPIEEQITAGFEKQIEIEIKEWRGRR